MKRITSLFGTALAGAALMGSAPSMAQPAGLDLDPAQVAAASRYALPIAFDGYMRKCQTNLAASGYARTNARSLRAKFAAGSNAAWPAAKSALVAMASKDGGDMTAVFEMMGDEALRPFVDAAIEGMVSEEIKTKDCADIERGLRILDPLPADNVAEMVGFLFEMSQREDVAAAAAR